MTEYKDENGTTVIDCNDDFEQEQEVAKNRSRWKSWALWVSILGAVSIVFSALGVWEKIGITSDAFETIVTAVGAILTAFGIVNNPTDKEGL